MDSSLKPLAYRLPEKVACQMTNSSLVLVRDFPLKIIRLHLSWKVSFELLSSGCFVSLKKIEKCLKNFAPKNIENFFDGLVRKGFLEREGISLITKYPFVSVIIPVRNRPEEIKACLQALGNLDYPLDKLEIIVVDDASLDQTPEVIKKFNVRLISLRKNRQASYCRNLAAQKSKGEILAFLDSDCVATPSWLKELVPAFKDPDVCAVGGRIDSFFNTTGLDRYEQVKSSLIIANHARRSSRRENFFYVPSCNLLVKKDLFHTVGRFDPDLVVGEDVDLCWRLQDAGHSVEFRPKGTIFHRHRNKIGAFCRRRFDYGTSEPLLQKLHPDRAKVFFFPVGGFLFWCVFFLSFFLMPSLLWICPALVFIDSLVKYLKTRNLNISISFFQHLKSVFRSYATLFYHSASFLSRYYLWTCLPTIFIFPEAFVILFYLHVFSGGVDYVIKKSALNPVSFFFYFTLEQLSYQAGVWSAVVKYMSFRPVIPAITFLKKF